ncbi:MAG: sodium:solute symporter, partial [Haloarculaceae archaeon]
MSAIALGLMGLYLVVTLGIGWYGYRRTGVSPQEYFLAGGTLGRVVFPLTMFATLMSAFIFLGSAGFGYQHGMAWLAMIGIEAVAGIPLAMVGLRAWRRARRHGYITPTELLGDTFDSDRLKLLVLLVQFAWAIPYVAIQAMGGGLIFSTISDGAVPFWAGALLVTVVTAVYLSLGGLRSVAWSDVLQGGTLVVMLVAALVYIVPAVDPLALTREVAANTDLLAPAGAVDFFTPRVWISFLLMNTMAIIAYPQMFQRFFAAEDERSFRALLVWWPIMALVAAVVPVLLGVWGTQVLPDLANPDQVIPALLQTYAPAAVVGVVMGGALAAMMSTADSLVLTLSSLVTRDLYHDHLAAGEGDERTELWIGRATIAVLLAAGYGLAHLATGRVPGVAAVGTIIDLAVYFIQGNALLLPAFLAALYWPRATATGAVASVVLGQAYFLAGAFFGAPAFGFMPFVPALALACFGLVAGTVLTADRSALSVTPET